jgi:hypothetical protein
MRLAIVTIALLLWNAAPVSAQLTLDGRPLSEAIAVPQDYAQPRDGLQTAINASVIAFVGLQMLDANLTTWILAKLDEICPAVPGQERCYQEANPALRWAADKPVALIVTKYAATAAAAVLILHVGDRDAPKKQRVLALITGIGLGVIGGVVSYQNFQHYQRIREGRPQ